MDRAAGLLSSVIKAMEDLSAAAGKLRAARRTGLLANEQHAQPRLLPQHEDPSADPSAEQAIDTQHAFGDNVVLGSRQGDPALEKPVSQEQFFEEKPLEEPAVPQPGLLEQLESGEFQHIEQDSEEQAHEEQAHEEQAHEEQGEREEGQEPEGQEPEEQDKEVLSPDLSEQWEIAQSPDTPLSGQVFAPQPSSRGSVELPRMELPEIFQIASAPTSQPATSAPVPESSVAIAALAGVSDEIVDQFVQDPELVAIVVEEMADLMPEIQDLLERLSVASAEDVSKLHRLVHTLKGTVGQVGALRARSVIHKMETVMEDLDAGHGTPSQVQGKLLEMYEAVHVLVRPLVTGEWAQQTPPSVEGKAAPTTVVPVAPRPSVRVAADQVDRMILEVDQARLASLAQEESAIAVRQRLRELEEVAQRSSLLLRELEIQSEIQMQSRQVASSENAVFDPLELDRFTRLQELARLTSEGVADVLEVRRDLMRLLSQQDAARARTGRYMQGVADALHRARLTPADAINDRMHNVVWSTARELGKEVSFELVGARVEVDRLLLEKILPPLDHVLRNSVAHGIEFPADRVRAGKPRQGLIRVTVKTAAGRAIIEVSDDGAGLNTDKIRQKAIEKGMWEKNRPMNDEQAAEMVCTPGFSTAEQVSQISGRGVGMDAVRNSVLSMGGRFTLVSRPGKGLDVFISIPTAVASAPVLLVEDGGEPWALPIDVVEQVVLAPRSWLDQAHENGFLPDIPGCPEGWAGTPFRRLCDMTGIQLSNLPPSQSPLLLLREQGKTLAVEVQRLSQVLEATLSPPGPIMSGVRGVAGSLVLPSGTAALLLDPFRATVIRSGPSAASPLAPVIHDTPAPAPTRPMVLIVDDSLTVRKAVIRFLGRHGYDHAQARDGQEALDLLERITPSAVILDVEMPRMDGFSCAHAIRENPRTAHLPLIMVTSRTADKHRQRAAEIGVNAYLGKPFKEEELNSVLRELISRPQAPSLDQKE